MGVMSERESKYVRFARIAYWLAKKNLPLYSHPKSPHRFTQPQLAACVLLAFYMRLSYRDMEEWLLASDKVCAVLELKRVPDHSTLARAYQRLLSVGKLQEMNRLLLDSLALEQEEAVAFDSSGFAPTQASTYYRSRRGKEIRCYHKAAYAVGTRSQFILAARHKRGPSGNDHLFLAGLRRACRRWVRKRHWLVLADSGFDGSKVKQGDLIPPIRRGGRLSSPERKARQDLVSQARLDGLYGQRWKVETVYSVIKRRFGDSIRSRLRFLQNREVTVLALVYNIHL